MTYAENQSRAFEKAMSDLVAAIGNVERLPLGLSPQQYQRGQDQAARLIGAWQGLRYPNGLPAKDHEFIGGIIP